MPEASFSVTYWHVEDETDMIPVVKELLQHGYYGTITGAVKTVDEAPVETWLLSLVGGGTATTVEVGDVVLWNGVAVQVMSREVFEARTSGT